MLNKEWERDNEMSNKRTFGYNEVGNNVSFKNYFKSIFVLNKNIYIDMMHYIHTILVS